MRRRDFIAAAGCAVMLPSVARAQQRTTTPMIGYLGSTAADEPREEAFRAGLREQGYTAGDNVGRSELRLHGLDLAEQCLQDTGTRTT